MKKLKEAFTQNLLIKLFSIAFAIILWVLVVNINNPRQSRNFTAKVDVTNANVLSDQGKYYTIPEGGGSVSFRVTAPRSIIERLSSKDFKAVADMRNLEEDSRIPVTISAVNYANSISISTRRYYINVEIGDQMEEKFIITAQTTGNPAGGFVVNTASVSPNVVTIRGPEPIVSTIKSVRAVCDVSGMNTKITENVVPTILDKNGNKVDTSKLYVSVSAVSVDVAFTNVKEVPIKLAQPDNANPYVEIDTINITPSRVRIMGDSSVLNDITEIEIPLSVVDTSIINQDTATTVDISQYLPAGANLTTGTEPEVSVDIKVKYESTRFYEVPAENILIRNLDEKYTVSYSEPTVRISGIGLPSELNNISPDTITGAVDAFGLGIGEHTLRVEPDEVQGVTLSPATIKITINSKESGDLND